MLNALCDLPFTEQPDIEPDATTSQRSDTLTKQSALTSARRLLRSYGMSPDDSWPSSEVAGLEHWRGDRGTAWFGGLHDKGPQLTVNINGVGVHVFVISGLAAFDVAVRALLEATP